MRLSKQHLHTLIKLVADAESDNGDCGSCFDHLAELAETKLEGKVVPEALKEVELHIEQCPCCKAEMDALIDGLKEML